MFCLLSHSGLPLVLTDSVPLSAASPSWPALYLEETDSIAHLFAIMDACLLQALLAQFWTRLFYFLPIYLPAQDSQPGYSTAAGET